MAPPTILITGAGGFIGRHLAEALRPGGRLMLHTGSRASADGLRAAGFADVAWGDLGAGAGAQGLPQAPVDAVIHLAGVLGGPRDAVRRGNVAATETLARWARSVGCGRMIFASSASVYAPMCRRPADETSRVEPRSPYAGAKAGAERCLQAGAGRMPVACLRLSHVYGPGKRAGIHSAILRALRAGEPVVLAGSGRERRDFIHVDDAVGALRGALEARLAPGFHVFNIGLGRSHTLREAAAEMAATLGAPCRIRLNGADATPPHCIRIATGKARHALHWRPTINLAEGTRATWLADQAGVGATPGRSQRQ